MVTRTRHDRTLRYTAYLVCPIFNNTEICLRILKAHSDTLLFERAKRTCPYNDVRHNVDVHTYSFVTH